MRLSSYLPAALAFLVAAVASTAAARLGVGLIERAALTEIELRLEDAGQGWAQVTVDGLQVALSGTAPDEATRFRALSLAGTVVDSARVIDAMEVDPGEAAPPPEFAIEILRNDSGISLIGLVPGAMDRKAVAATIAGLADGAPVTDLLESADYPVPGGWAPALSFALDALGDLPRSKISVTPDSVAITASVDSREDKRRLEAALTRTAPDAVALTLTISAPRPVITPFTLRYVLDDAGGRFDACTAYTEAGRDTILAAAAAAGLTGEARCTLGLGVPSPQWPEAVALGLAALAELGGGTITFTDADVALVARDTALRGVFDRVTGRLDAALPAFFSLTAVLPEPVQVDGTGEGEDGPPEFVATLSPEGLVQLRGRITDARLERAVEGFARVQFQGADVINSMRMDPDLPQGWAARVFAGLEALAELNNGAVVVQPDFLDLRGDTGRDDARAEVSRILATRLGEADNYAITIDYEEQLDPLAALPTPEECVARINQILAEQKITFAPGSDDIDAAARDSIERIADAMTDCGRVPMEVAGHTDSQGRESMNQQLSQRRAEAVLTALRARRVLTGNLTAVGYGEARPIADNGTEEGREANRRIEFTLIEPEGEGAETVAAKDPEAGETGDTTDAATEATDE